MNKIQELSHRLLSADERNEQLNLELQATRKELVEAYQKLEALSNTVGDLRKSDRDLKEKLAQIGRLSNPYTS